MADDRKPSSFEAVIAAFAVATTFVLGFGYWHLATRQNEQDARFEHERRRQDEALANLARTLEERRAADNLESQVFSVVAPHLSRLRDAGRDASNAQSIVAAAAELLAAKGRPGLLQLTKKLQETAAPARAPVEAAPQPVASADRSGRWLVLLATVPGDAAEEAERIANIKLELANSLGIAKAVSIYRTTLKKRYVVALETPLARREAIALAAEARRQKLAGDAFAEQVAGWEHIGTAPFPTDRKSASLR
jgi:hypothetical protein